MAKLSTGVLNQGQNISVTHALDVVERTLLDFITS
jgi:hypothetical protein